MVRKARAAVLYDGCYAHVFSRSIEKRRIFPDQQDFVCFKDLIVKAKEQNPFSIFHYCFMHTHFHLAVGEQSRLLRELLREKSCPLQIISN